MKQEIKKIILNAIKQYLTNNNIQNIIEPDFIVECPKIAKFGDYSTNIAMKLAPILKKNPLAIAEALKESLKNELFQKIDIIPPGFINFFVNENDLSKKVQDILQIKDRYGYNNIGQGKKVQIEFISANPTGPLTLGNGRGGFSGDCLANVFKFCGYQVKREYYVNDRGKQIDLLTESVIRRYLQQEGIKVDFPEELYKGEYIKDLAKKIKLKDFNVKIAEIQKVKKEIKDWVLQQMIDNIKYVAEKKCGIKYDCWFKEKSLYTSDLKAQVWDELLKKQLIYQNDNAWWFRSSVFGDEKDRVIVKKDGEPTYLFSDILYLKERFYSRGFDKVIMIWGCDHHGDIQRVMAVAQVFDRREQLNIIIYQLVRLMFNGKELKMSKRKGTYVTLEELVDEVGIDVVRWFFLMYEVNSHMDFDLNLAKKKSEQNPVFYVQYAYARICNIIQKVPKKELLISQEVSYTNSSELDLIKELIKFPDLIEEILYSYEVHKIPQFVLELARKFHRFYTDCRVIEGDKVNNSRLALIMATKTVIANLLELMGISAPEKM